MRNTIAHTAEWILLGIITILFCYTAYKSYQLKQKVETVYITDTVRLSDTITQFQPYDVHHYRTDTAYLPVIEEKLDTILKIDSVLVEVPISIYKYDSIMEDSAHTTRIHAVIQGFAVSLDTLSVNTEIHQQEPKKQPWYGNIGVGVGLMYGTGGAGVGIGLMYRL